MKTPHQGFIAPLLLALVALFIGVGAYVYVQNKPLNQSAVVPSTSQATSTTQTQTENFKSIKFSTSVTSGIAPLVIYFFAALADGTTNNNLYSVEFGDGASAPMKWENGKGTNNSWGLSVAHTYAKPGTYTAKLVADVDSPGVKFGGKYVGTATVTVTSSNSQTANWKTYTNTKYGFSFKYPPSWFLRETPDENIVDFSKSELTSNDLENFKKIFLSLYISNLILGKEGSGYKTTPQEYFTYYYNDTRPNTSSWTTVDGKPIYYGHIIGTDSRVLVDDYSYLLFTADKIFILNVKPGVLLNYITGPWQSTEYEPKDDDLIRQVIGTLSLSDTSVQFVNAGVSSLPHIDSALPSSVSIGSSITVNGRNFEWVPPANCQTNGCIAQTHTFTYIMNSSGQKAILAEDGVFQNRQILTTMKSSLCTRSQGNGLPCEPMTITPGIYSLSITVDGKGTSNSVPITITN